MAKKIEDAFGGVKGKTIAVLGLTFKPNTDDMRDAPSLVIVPALVEQGAKVKAYDPVGMSEAAKLLPALEMATDPYACAEGADVLVIVTEWEQFRALDLSRLKSALGEPAIIDLRNVYSSTEMTDKGFRYFSVGRG